MFLDKVLKNIYALLSLIIILNLFISNSSQAVDSDQFRGPNRNGIFKETGLLKSWPADGPAMIWKNDDLGNGYSSATLVNGIVYITGDLDKTEHLFAIDNKTGKTLWKSPYGPRWDKSFPETRCTPTIDGNNIYVISGMGNLACFNKTSGKQVWAVQVVEKFKGEYHRWGISDAILVVGNNVYCTPGGPDASVVALNKTTGATVWTSKGISDKSNYCAPILVEQGGKKIIVTMLENGFVGLDAASRKKYWYVPYTDYLPKNHSINPNSPVFYKGSLYFTSGYDTGSARFDLSADGTKVTKKWVDSNLDVHIGGVVILDGYIYGANWHNNSTGNWICLDWETGKMLYDQEWFSKGSTVSADGMLYCYEEKDGHIALVKPNPAKFEIISSFQVPQAKGPYWAHPTIANGTLYLRHGASLMAYDIKAK